MSITLCKGKVSDEDAVWIDPEIIIHPKLGNKAVVVYIYLLGVGGKDISKQDIADDIGCGIRSVYRAIKQLKENNLYYEYKDPDKGLVCYLGSSKETAQSIALKYNNKGEI